MIGMGVGTMDVDKGGIISGTGVGTEGGTECGIEGGTAGDIGVVLGMVLRNVIRKVQEVVQWLVWGLVLWMLGKPQHKNIAVHLDIARLGGGV